MPAETRRVWSNMLWRCRSRSRSRKWYFDKGIHVCLRWLKYDNFVRDMGERPPGLTLERKDNAKGYSPSNCRWATRQEQGRNKTDNRFLPVAGRRVTVAEAAEILGVKANTLICRLRRGWTEEETVTGKHQHQRTRRIDQVLSKIIADRHAGLSLPALSRKYGFDSGHLSRVLRKERAPSNFVAFRKRRIAELCAKISRLRATGLTFTAIAKRLNLPYSTTWLYATMKP